MNAIETHALSKQYGKRMAVDKLEMTVKEGELFALLGQNGAGKTTTIKMLCCLLAPSSGDAFMLGDSITQKPAAVKQKINLSPQETAIAPNLTVRENLELIARLYGAEKAQAQAEAQEMLATFNLEERANDKAKKLSGGMQRRLSIAMALISHPRILFLDEPTLGLDVRARRELWKIVKKLHGSITIVLTTHYLEEAEALADRIGIIEQGTLQIVGTADELKARTGTESLEDAFLKLTGAEVEA